MSKYYCLIAGLPNISLDDTKIPFTISEFREELNGVLTDADRKLIDLFFLKFDNKNLITQAKHPDFDPDTRGMITYHEFNDLFQALKEEEKPPVNKRIPLYFEEFFKLYLASESKDEKKIVPWDDVLAALYYDYAMKCKNEFVAKWFEMNLNINNMFTAITCRKYDFDRSDYIVGNNQVAESLRTSNARDFGLGDTEEYLTEVQRIAEETDLFLREKKTDQLKWQWLEDNTFFKTFDIESVFAYLLKIEMMERWVVLDRATGEKTFRELVGTMKKGSGNALEEFKRNNKK
ncbi:hypothetical protein M2459_001461 [Parabacteroides sp. PF5-5]|uniref:DUF2764 domain-containing protein n=1 Tax=unclassified Parabacteroides TaxID=2649774 RepID=UPI0024744394|nr:MULTISPECIES: DUF2764 domain-containing protein [unclassified Parabacteroides]MDH6304724.1 hypothetical protein [Parabacteroides sp. PH5-39]MDH6315661.1 hypothetical protein [Parabacteroides sp. PF5-13]MDH6319322.1 hypothetical protein [Parabacteroides sp. PH5-13]MDH6323053.1 hypothetical protein [Parabacteroides sp. PH5-8]MDH6326854.1 hypothetical protein [Parabacteroides sp. PH5-41]